MNETIQDIIKDIRKNDGLCISPTSLFAFDEDGGILLGDLADRIEAAVARERMVVDGDYESVIDEQAREIERLRAALKPVLAVEWVEVSDPNGVRLEPSPLPSRAVKESQRIYKEMCNEER